MTYKHLLRYKPWLRPVHEFNICNRMLEATNGNVFIVYNTIQHAYELHTIEAYNLSGDSYNTSLDKECINGFIYYDYRANNYTLFQDEVYSERKRREIVYDKQEQKKHDLDSLLKMVERTLGTKV